MAEELTVAEIIEILSACNPHAYVNVWHYGGYIGRYGQYENKVSTITGLMSKNDTEVDFLTDSVRDED